MTLASNELSKIAKKIKFFACDIDGVMTDGGIILSEYQGEYKRFDVQDGMGITMIRKAGLKTGIITGRVSEVVRKRAEELNFDEICQGFFWKEKALENILEKYQLAEEEIAYVGDDILDLPVLQRVGLPIAVQNARPEVRNKCYYTSNASGGHGAIREIVDWLLDLRNERQVIIDYYTNSG